jgi:hypothetical protein
MLGSPQGEDGSRSGWDYCVRSARERPRSGRSRDGTVRSVELWSVEARVSVRFLGSPLAFLHPEELPEHGMYVKEL